MRDLGAVFDHDEPLPHPALLFRREPTTHVRVHRIARNNHRVGTTAVLAVERAVFEA
jgi:hypothetical protein